MRLWALCLGFFALCAQAGLPDTVARIKPSVVGVGTYLPTRSPAFRFVGTGFVVGDGTLVATNAHVMQVSIDPGSLERWVIAIPDEKGRADIRSVQVVVSDVAHDLVVLRQSGAALHPMFLRDANESLREGEELNFTGYPIGTVLGLFPVTHRALVSALSPISVPRANSKALEARDIRVLDKTLWPVIQLDATAYPGNSGSPLYHPQSGEVVGIVNMVFVKANREAALSSPSGITFAIPARHLAALLRNIAAGQ